MTRADELIVRSRRLSAESRALICRSRKRFGESMLLLKRPHDAPCFQIELRESPAKEQAVVFDLNEAFRQQREIERELRDTLAEVRRSAFEGVRAADARR